jgi:integrase
MQINLIGINKVRKRLSDGRVKIYYYHRKTGIKIEGTPGSPEFINSYQNAAISRIQTAAPLVITDLIERYRKSVEFKSHLADSTQKEYTRKLSAINKEFGDLKISALNRPEVKRIIMDYRTNVAGTSGARESDYRLSVFSALISWSQENGYVNYNYLKGFKRLYRVKRQENIWLPDHIDAFMRIASVELQRALIIALHSGLRQGDILKLSWANYDGTHLKLRIGKNGRKGNASPITQIPCTRTLCAALDAIPRKNAVILTTKEGRPFTARYFGHLWSLAYAKSGLTADLHFNDLRGTTVTLLAAAGSTIPEIVAITKHSLQSATRILETYLYPTLQMAEQAKDKFENNAATQFANQLQTIDPDYSLKKKA